jgi:hypothetical protein
MKQQNNTPAMESTERKMKRRSNEQREKRVGREQMRKGERREALEVCENRASIIRGSMGGSVYRK